MHSYILMTDLKKTLTGHELKGLKLIPFTFLGEKEE